MTRMVRQSAPKVGRKTQASENLLQQILSQPGPKQRVAGSQCGLASPERREVAPRHKAASDTYDPRGEVCSLSEEEQSLKKQLAEMDELLQSVLPRVATTTTLSSSLQLHEGSQPQLTLKQELAEPLHSQQQDPATERQMVTAATLAAQAPAARLNISNVQPQPIDVDAYAANASEQSAVHAGRSALFCRHAVRSEQQHESGQNAEQPAHRASASVPKAPAREEAPRDEHLIPAREKLINHLALDMLNAETAGNGHMADDAGGSASRAHASSRNLHERAPELLPIKGRGSSSLRALMLTVSHSSCGSASNSCAAEEPGPSYKRSSDWAAGEVSSTGPYEYAGNKRLPAPPSLSQGGSGVFDRNVEKLKRTADKMDTLRRQKEEENMAECTFSPNLTTRSIPRQSSKAPAAWKLADDSEDESAAGLGAQPVRALTGGMRMYAEAVQTRREWLQHLQKLQQMEEATKQQHTFKAKPLKPLIYGPQPHRNRHSHCSNPPHGELSQCTFQPRTNSRRPTSAPHMRPGVLEASIGSIGKTQARAATPPRGSKLPYLATPQPLRSRTAPAWGPPPSSPSPCTLRTSDSGSFWGSGSMEEAMASVSDLGLSTRRGFRPALTVELDQKEFLERQSQFLQEKEAKLAVTRRAASRPASPTLSRGTQRIFQSASAPLDARAVAAGMKATWDSRRQAMQEQPTFKPGITMRGQRRAPRSPEALSAGDWLRQQYLRELLRLEQLQQEEQELTFRPAINNYPDVRASYEIRQPEKCAEFQQLKQQRYQESSQRATFEKQAEEKATCTFTPSIKRELPSFIYRIKRQQHQNTKQESL